MKILLVTSNLDGGGAEKWMVDTVSHMNREDVSIDYYFFGTIKDDVFLKKYQEIGVKSYVRDLENPKSAVVVRLAHDLKKFIAQHGPYDAIHLNGTKILYQMIVMQVAKKAKIPCRMLHNHNAKFSDLSGIRNKIRAYCQKNAVKNATIVGGCSQLAATTKYGDQILNSEKFHLFQNGICIEQYHNTQQLCQKYKQELNIENVVTFIHVGRMSKEKNHTFLLDVFQKIVQQKEDAKLILIGDGEDKQTVFEKIKRLGLQKNVIHIPYTAKTNKYYIASDLLLLPSLWEGLPLVALEAQAAGIPCILSKNISKEVIVNSNVEVLPLNNNASEWATKALELAGLKCKDAQENIRKAGYDIAVTAEDFLRCCKGEG